MITWKQEMRTAWGKKMEDNLKKCSITRGSVIFENVLIFLILQ